MGHGASIPVTNNTIDDVPINPDTDQAVVAGVWVITFENVNGTAQMTAKYDNSDFVCPMVIVATRR